ncbi:sensor histidine kinase [Streptomyces pluripotens]|uniref:histidine kinase n=1 Tax=Streptomyces pluripotens TaxID=1355015 RepID=A0A221NZ51_9ACTN|nr:MULTISPECIES: HAMP domain-containing sensor histidine kinase [Streptomyces]ARP71027.1 two-component sensor histidine kinase [Streptomyces pluripotens]ASN25279.1 sensor histidine kinase [Streptomyces pluripotens]MCH0557209.1 HAMP domain-containing histidine kinase [Streptomyces sp. MUM 16J]
MRLRARLALLVAVLLTGAVVVLGGGTLWWTRSSLVDEADARLLRARAQPQPAPSGGSADRAQPPARRAVALLRFDARGHLEQTTPSEATGDPDPLPAVSWPAALSGGPDGGIRSAESVDGTLDYHWTAVRRPDGGVTVFAVSLGEVARTAGLLLWSLLLGGGTVVALGGGIGWWVVRRELRPLDDLVQATAAVAAGDVTPRTGARPSRGEMGRLTAGFDHMLVRLDASLAARESARLKLEQFVADASHELRTPLALVRGYAELHGRGGLPPGPRLDRAMSRIAAETARMTGLVEDLLFLARLDHEATGDTPKTNGQTKDQTYVDAYGGTNGEANGGTNDEVDEGGTPAARVEVAAVLREAVEEHRVLGPGHPVGLDAATGLTVCADRLRLRQVAGNLLANVRAHTPPGTATRITAEAAGPVTEILVADNGPGIPAADRPYVFDRFFRPHGSRARTRAGSGLGLAIVSALVSSCGGTVTAMETPGGGATFLVRLPRLWQAEGSAAPEPSASAQEGFSGVHR